MATWRKLIDEFLAECGDQDTIIYSTFLNATEWDEEFDGNRGPPEGRAFTAWSREWTYFPICNESGEYVGRAPSNPGNHKCEHVGSW